MSRGHAWVYKITYSKTFNMKLSCDIKTTSDIRD